MYREELTQRFINKSQIIKFIALDNIIILAHMKYSKKVKCHDISQNVTCTLLRTILLLQVPLYGKIKSCVTLR
jgi:hypothetical protein